VNLASILSTSARIYPDRAAVRLGDAVTTYTELDERSALVAGLLSRRGLRPGDRVGIMLPNIPDFAALYYGVLRAGGVVVPLNPMLKAREVAYYLSDSGAAVMFGSEANTPEARAGADRAGANVITVGADLDAELTGGAAVRGATRRLGSRIVGCGAPASPEAAAGLVFLPAAGCVAIPNIPHPLGRVEEPPLGHCLDVDEPLLGDADELLRSRGAGDPVGKFDQEEAGARLGNDHALLVLNEEIRADQGIGPQVGASGIVHPDTRAHFGAPLLLV